ncbi:MAG: glycosyltransferase family 4 protein, partial [Armatimonadota bacterium]
MRIAMLGVKAVPTIGGIARYVEEVGARLVERGHEVTVYCRPHYLNGSNGSYRGMERVVSKGLRGKHLDTITHTFTSLRDALRRDFDVLHFHGVGPGILAPLARPGNGQAIVVTAHGADWDRAKWSLPARTFLRVGARVSARAADGWVAVSHSVASECERVGGSRADVVPSGTCPVQTPRPTELARLGLAPGEYLFCAARLTPEKGLHYLVEAFERAAQGKKLVIAGAAGHRSRYATGLQRSTNGDVSFVGFVQGR